MRRAAVYLWASPATLVGLFVAVAFLRRGRLSLVDGVVEAHGPRIRALLSRLPTGAGPVAAITLGHVVLGSDAETLRRTRLHERVHVAQYERWGPAFIPAYLAASAWALARGRHPYFDNRFEREAWELEPTA